MRILPVAISIGVGSMLGVRLSVAVGNKVVVAVGLTMVGASFAWVSTASAATSYLEIAGQMVLAGIGLGFTTAPATEAIMGVVPIDKAGVGSAVNDATRELGGTLGVAVIGSVYASLYHSGLDAPDLVVDRRRASAPRKESIGAAIATAQQLGPTARNSSPPPNDRSSTGSKPAASSPPACCSPARSSPPSSCPPGRDHEAEPPPLDR